jgi:hypothetical protein
MNNRMDKIILLVFAIIFFLVGIRVFNGIKKIFINITSNEIIFKYGLFPYIKIKKVKISDIKEISINRKSNHFAASSRSSYTFKYIEKEHIYNVDIIDYQCNAYRIYQSTVYNEELIEFSKEIGKILNININDQSNIRIRANK